MKKPKWPKLPKLLIPLFHSAHIYLCRSREEWRAACDALRVSHGEIEMLGGCTASFVDKSQGENLYLLGVFNNDISTLVHECAHISFYTCRDVGVIIDTDSANETYCYLLDKMFSHFLPFIQEVKEETK